MREIQLFFGGTHIGKQIKGFVMNAICVGVRTIDLVQAQYRTQAQLQGLTQNEFGLRHDAFFGIDKQDTAINHA